jgi:CubicO group peptidase (beta-lactamase class C family)
MEDSTMPVSKLKPQHLQRAITAMHAGIERKEAGASVMAVASSSDIILLETAPSLDGSENPKEDSIFLLASITKPFMSTAALQMVEQGKLLYSDQVKRHVPEFACYGKENVSVWNLLTHTSGLADEACDPVWASKGEAGALLDATCKSFLHFTPGSQWEYCNTSWWVTGEIIRRLSGLTYPDYLRQGIFEPLGMKDTAFDFSGEQASRMMPVHDQDEHGRVSSPERLSYFKSINLAAGGLWSSALDLVKFGQAMLNGLAGRGTPIASKAGIAMMTRLHTAGILERGDSSPAAYGLGWSKNGSRVGPIGTERAFGHGGATATLLWIEPDYDLAFVYLTNLWGMDNRVAHMCLNTVLAAMG